MSLYSALEQTLDAALGEIGAPWGAIALHPEASVPPASGGLLLVTQRWEPLEGDQPSREEPSGPRGMARPPEDRPPAGLFHTPEGTFRTQAGSWPTAQRTLNRVVGSGEMVLVEDLAQAPGYAGLSPESRSQMAAPILSEGRPAGALVLESPERAAFDADDLDRLARLARHATLALENARLRYEVERLQESKWEFVDVAAHELKQPLTSMQGYARMLSLGVGGALNESQQRFVEVIEANVDRMGALVNDLLDVARMEAGRIELHVEPLALNELVDEALAPLRESIEAKGQTLSVVLPGDVPPIPGDQERLGRALAHVVRNAHQYTPPGGRIRIQGWHQAGWVYLAVRDTGIGIAAADQAELFGKFFRAADPAVQEVRGSGVGLYLASRLLEVHGGDLRVESVAGEGSTFTLILRAG